MVVKSNLKEKSENKPRVTQGYYNIISGAALCKLAHLLQQLIQTEPLELHYIKNLHFQKYQNIFILLWKEISVTMISVTDLTLLH